MEKKITLDLDDGKVSGKGIMYEINLNQQCGKYLCWAAVTEAIHKHFGKKGFTQKDKKNIETDPYDFLEEAYKLKKKKLSKCIIKSQLSREELKYLIREEGGPLIFTTPQDKVRCSSLHYILVIGYITFNTINKPRGELHVIVKDPYPISGKISKKAIKVDPTLVTYDKFKQCGFLYTTILDDKKLNKKKCY